LISGAAITETLISLIMSLTPIERLEAARRLDSMPTSTTKWFIYLGIITVIILAVLLVVISYGRRARESKSSADSFKEHSDRRGLSKNERQVLMQIVEIAGLKRSESIFTMSSAFDRGATAVIEKSFVSQDAEYGQRLRSEIAFLREKLGFQNQHPDITAWMMNPQKLSSRRIPVGKKLYLSSRGNRTEPQVYGKVIKSDDINITLGFESGVDFQPGDLLCVNYYFGVSAWEFDSSVINCDGNTLVLQHSDRIRFINRRRFLRVAVNKTAYIAHYPFNKVFTFRTKINQEAENEKAQAEKQVSDKVWGAPEFLPGMITEIAGPGLRIKTPLELKTGEKVLIVFKLNEIREQDPNSENVQIRTIRIVEGVGIVKHVTTFEDGLQVAVELFGLEDSDLNELIRATNNASLNGKSHSEDSSQTQENARQAVAASKGD
jgi:hypothetical protein